MYYAELHGACNRNLRNLRFPTASRTAHQNFTFTLNCHLGKTHSHRSRGDTAWGAQRGTPKLGRWIHTLHTLTIPHLILNSVKDPTLISIVMIQR